MAPVIGPNMNFIYNTKKAGRITPVGSSLGCFQIANELIVMIFEEIDDVYDAIMLGLTHDTLMVIGWGHIQSLLRQVRPPWAGCRIICAGIWAEDLPEQDNLSKLAGLHSESDQPEPWREDFEPKQFNLYQISERISRKPHLWFHLVDRRRSGLSSVERRALQEIIDHGYYSWFGWVLMNLSKKEYVESKAAAKILPWMDATEREANDPRRFC